MAHPALRRVDKGMAPTPKPRLYPWRERNGRLSWLKLVTFVALFLPGLWNVGFFAAGMMGPRPLNALIHALGLWAIRLLFLSLAITPLRRLLELPQLVKLRRMIGVAAFAYALAHFVSYTADQSFDLAKVASEIVLRFYLTIGFVALLGLSALAVTSTDKMLRRLGGARWQRLHRLVYLIAILGNVHYFIQAKLEVTEPLVLAGLLLWMLAFRATVARLPSGWQAVAGTALLSVVACVVTALGEALYFMLKFHAPVERILAADFMLTPGIRPAWVVLAIGAAITLTAALRTLRRSPRTRLEPA
jgi:sulfoxide reductase heme-binding subunit YedZ